MRILQKWIPLFSINGVLYIVSAIFFCVSVSIQYMSKYERCVLLSVLIFQYGEALKDLYPRLGMLGIISTAMFCVIISMGQSVENEVITVIIYYSPDNICCISLGFSRI
jgi:hypothetical protein